MYQSNLMYRANLTREFRSALYFRHCCSWQGVTRFAAENCRTYRQLGRTDHQRIINGQAWNRYVNSWVRVLSDDQQESGKVIWPCFPWEPRAIIDCGESQSGC